MDSLQICTIYDNHNFDASIYWVSAALRLLIIEASSPGWIHWILAVVCCWRLVWHSRFAWHWYWFSLKELTSILVLPSSQCLGCFRWLAWLRRTEELLNGFGLALGVCLTLKLVLAKGTDLNSGFAIFSVFGDVSIGLSDSKELKDSSMDSTNFVC